MAAIHADAGLPPEFARAVATLREVRLRPEVALDEVPAPQRLAPHSVALAADVLPPGRHAGTDDDALDIAELATGRFVVLYDPEGQESWQGTTRVVAYVKADLELEMAADPFLGEVGWTWLTEALGHRAAQYRAAGGTVTRVTSESYGSMSKRAPSAQVELRASWTAVGEDLAAHLQAWADVLCEAAGLPPLPPGVASLPTRRR